MTLLHMPSFWPIPGPQEPASAASQKKLHYAVSACLPACNCHALLAIHAVHDQHRLLQRMYGA